MGAAGLFLMAATGIVAGVQFFFTGIFFFSYDSYPILVPITGTLVLFSSLLALAGYYGQYHHYGSGMGAASAVYLLVAGVLFITLTVASVQRLGGSYHPYWTTNILMYWGAYVVFGVALILMGASHLISRNHMGMPGLGVASGILFIIGGSFIISYILSFVGFFIMTAAGICAGINFARAAVYNPEDLPHVQTPDFRSPAYGWPPYQPRPPF